MHSFFRSPALTIIALCGACLAFAAAPDARSQGTPAAQSRAANSAPDKDRTIPALLVSDIHFDPFHDPGKAQKLVAAPVSQWASILAGPPSATHQQAFDALQSSCHARGVDTPFALLRSSLEAMRARQPEAKFMTVSGDLIAHGFTCRYATLVPGAKPGDYQAFVVKTLSFVMNELRAAFPGMPIYMALGNNDTGCGDYQLDTNSDFLAESGKILVQGLPASEREKALKEFAANGSYSVAMAEPMKGARLISLNDLFLSQHYSTCAGKSDPAAATAELNWLDRELDEARHAGEKVWVLGHIPPGIDPYSTIVKFRNICGGQVPVSFLANDKLAELLAAYADVVRLAIFAHTHRDEVRLLRPEEKEAPVVASTAVKLVASISPVNGNTPSFTVARVDPSAGMLENYAVITASNQTGIGAKWTSEYDFAATYHKAQFSSATVKELITAFRADAAAQTPESQAYLRNYFGGDMSPVLAPFWPEYVCSLGNHSAKAFAGCMCSPAK